MERGRKASWLGSDRNWTSPLGSSSGVENHRFEQERRVPSYTCPLSSWGLRTALGRGHDCMHPEYFLSTP